MTEPVRHPGPVVVLPLDSWLYEARPAAGCRTCEEAARALEAAKRAGKAWERFEAARTIRRHPHDQSSPSGRST
ncbi:MULTISPECIES: hypothetical protein [Streptomyces]|uniref:Uncharacterized protein n=1 Tax=Streptomyces thermoviolaceus subsp. thermoviolaceus TaxID=66860 RepID=A0ABX0YSN3_STRTL|nr:MULTISPECIES: hypothetical protein [Streptomyces]MCM3264654.1 hypothetical protein [Streptomyces thermoviolaceus]NJP15587.1 hypothetical protein [Streptomyces thermoviolaceus subsp. thermoviolaceus]RSS05052.1 hypothetical protein EF917_10760 [Streptomyces sp. WAC00469]WTD48802.1 hypothetical protein OG899_15560 [Streptomyces thermoviolaceus]GGV69077.1 hypothetical protein GCM10010499_17170 [Streptomyces thermoviolaceus subsp. apingens]